MLRGHFFFNAVRAQFADLASHINAGFVYGIPEEITGVAANDQAAFLRHKGAHMPYATRYNDVHALH